MWTVVIKANFYMRKYHTYLFYIAWCSGAEPTS